MKIVCQVVTFETPFNNTDNLALHCTAHIQMTFTLTIICDVNATHIHKFIEGQHSLFATCACHSCEVSQNSWDSPKISARVPDVFWLSQITYMSWNFTNLELGVAINPSVPILFFIAICCFCVRLFLHFITESRHHFFYQFYFRFAVCPVKKCTM